MAKFNVELTDTFSGEPNYSWVRRAVVEVPDAGFYHNARSEQAQIMRAAKAAVGLTGVPGRTEAYGDSFTFRPRGLLQVMFVTFDDSPAV